MSIFMAIFLGIVQGVAEFLPISSSGHLAIFQNLFNMNYNEDNHLFFEVLLHLGTLISIIFVYRKDISEMIRDALYYLRMKSDSNDDEPIVLKPAGRTLLFIIIGTLPLLIALVFSSAVSSLFFNMLFIGFALIITGSLLFVSSRYIKPGTKTGKTMTVVDAIVIGLAQAVAVLPGLSRSGTTISVGLTRGLSSSFAVKFSLLLSIPAVLGATLITFLRAVINGIDFGLLPAYLIGFVFATGIGFLAIQILRRVIAKDNLGYFSYYCWIVGAITIIWSFFRM